jgi:hypothetical protein
MLLVDDVHIASCWRLLAGETLLVRALTGPDVISTISMNIQRDLT